MEIMRSLEWLLLPDQWRLENGERVILRTSANRIHRLGVQPGQLILTNNRVLFLPFRFRFVPRFFTWAALDLELVKVMNAARGPAWALSRWVTGLPGFPVVVLQRQEGRKVSFQTRNAVKIQEEIQGLIGAGGLTRPSDASVVDDTD